MVGLPWHQAAVFDPEDPHVSTQIRLREAVECR